MLPVEGVDREGDDVGGLGAKCKPKSRDLIDKHAPSRDLAVVSDRRVVARHQYVNDRLRPVVVALPDEAVRPSLLFVVARCEPVEQKFDAGINLGSTAVRGGCDLYRRIDVLGGAIRNVLEVVPALLEMNGDAADEAPCQMGSGPGEVYDGGIGSIISVGTR